MSSEKKIVIKCWNCEKKFTISISDVDSSIVIYKIYKGLLPLAKHAEAENKKKRLLETCPYCGKENQIEI